MIVRYKDQEYNFSEWQGYSENMQCVNGKTIYPDFVRIANYFGSFETIIMLKCFQPSRMYVKNPAQCYWYLRSDLDFKFIIPIYNNLYGTLIPYKDLDLAKSRIDKLLLKVDDLKAYL